MTGGKRKVSPRSATSSSCDFSARRPSTECRSRRRKKRNEISCCRERQRRTCDEDHRKGHGVDFSSRRCRDAERGSLDFANRAQTFRSQSISVLASGERHGDNNAACSRPSPSRALSSRWSMPWWATRSARVPRQCDAMADMVSGVFSARCQN